MTKVYFCAIIFGMKIRSIFFFLLAVLVPLGLSSYPAFAETSPESFESFEDGENIFAVVHETPGEPLRLFLARVFPLKAGGLEQFSPVIEHPPRS
ncbi:MAG: hypothetical protein ACYC5N_07075 [Endomicrobiales bacterium]